MDDGTEPVEGAVATAPAPRDDAELPSADLELRRVRVLTVWVSESSRQRLLESFDYELLEDISQADKVDLILVSTRMPRGHAPGLFEELRRRSSAAVVAVVHAGGEGVAVEFLRFGASAVLAEGNEESLRVLLGIASPDTRLVEAYDRRLGRATARTSVGRSRDAVTGLPPQSLFEGRLADLGQSGALPRVGLLRIVNLEEAARRLSSEAVAVLRRRIATQFRERCRTGGVELYGLGHSDFAFVAVDLEPEEAQALGWDLARITETFSPSGSAVLTLAVGHAGPEVASEVPTLRELAQRALQLAEAQRESTVVNADDLSRSLASTTELEAALRAVDAVERRTGGAPGHGARTAGIANDLARAMGFDGHDRTQIRLAGHLHDIGAIVEATDEDPDGEVDHAARGASYLQVSAGADVAAAVRGHHEHWDGSGAPDGLEGQTIPLAARIVAVACAVERWSAAAGDEEAGRRAAVERLQAEAGTRFDPAVVEIAVEVLTEDVEPAREEELVP